MVDKIKAAIELLIVVGGFIWMNIVAFRYIKRNWVNKKYGR